METGIFPDQKRNEVFGENRRLAASYPLFLDDRRVRADFYWNRIMREFLSVFHH